ncbi:MAG: DUF4301 family protein [Deltaproteobacteria bacterium]|nr:DUF4301 family protein [Deltaproteobacteria bacterium]
MLPENRILTVKDTILTEEIISQLKEKGVSKEAAFSQIETFKKGIPYTELVRPCTIGDGIENIDEEVQKYVGLYESESESKKVIKFVPASGAASRMFKELLAVTGRGSEINKDALYDAGDSDSRAFLRFVDSISNFAFYNELKTILEKNGFKMDQLLEDGEYKEIADYTLGLDGLNYANLPKGIIKFHRYGDYSRTAFEEHLVEASVYSKDGKGISRVHFTVSLEHLGKVKELLDREIKVYEKNGVKFEISYSVQKPSTDTIAVDMKNRPFLDDSSMIVLRPGGHGALIENLNELDCDVAFIKNIDNVVPDRLKVETSLYKKALGGYLLNLQSKMFGYLKKLDAGQCDNGFLEILTKFINCELKIELSSDFGDLSIDEKLGYLRAKLDRPVRICGVVKNIGEPGGGPFWVRGSNGNLTKQIVESSQVDMNSQEQKSIWDSSTHFNPVDIVCGLKNYKEEPFDLRNYVDPDMGFISHKSKDGRDLKALELPGLWNGAMADWNTLFVEVPLSTFNPVKTIFDLLRSEHQAEE